MSFDWLVARPIAHRGWHDAAAGRIENSLGAAEAAIAGGFAIECDVQRSADGEAVVFHDERLERLTEGEGPVAALSAAQLRALSLRGGGRIPTLAELLALVGGRTPLICEIKSGFDGDERLADRVAEIAGSYNGALAFKSFDPNVIRHLRERGEPRPLGIVAEADYSDSYFRLLSPAQKQDLVTFRHYPLTRPDFLSWRVDDLPHVTPTLLRALKSLPIMAWTVRRPEQWALARAYADQPVFEGAPLT